MKEILLGLASAPGVGWSTILKIVSQGIDEACLGWSRQEWQNAYTFLKDDQCIQLEKYAQWEVIHQMLEELTKKKVSLIDITDPRYPQQLKEIYDPPWLLYAIGNLALLEQPSISFVGSRKTTKYGAAAAVRLIQPLVQEGWCIVSGMALGIDAISHRVALQEKGKTIAILGSGIDVPYPRQHQQLYQQIADKGLILSEYPLGLKPHPAFFPRRNRIIAGLSYGTVVIEANEQSGSLITAQLALEQGRDVFAVPGSIFDQQSKGTNLLIQQQGAKLILKAQDILEEYSHLPLNKCRKDSHGGLKSIEIADDNERMLLDALALEKKHIQEICEELTLSFADVSRALLRLELKNLIQALPGSYYQRIN